MKTYNRWTMHVMQYSLADDGFGNLIRIQPDIFWRNADAARIDLYNGGGH